MLRYLVPKRSRAHRVACFALYRALLSQCSGIVFAPDQKTALQNLIRKEFRKNAELQSQRLLMPTLRAGYEAQALLSSAAMGSATAKSHILSLLDSMTSSPKRPKPRLIPTTSPASPTSPVPKRKPTQPPAPYPGATPVLSRPYPTTSGRRRVPKIVNGNGIPFLRFKKPQSPFLSRIIRDKIKQRTRRFDLMHALENSIQAAEDEDRWDDMIREEYGIGDGIGDGIGKERRSGPRWVDEVHNGKRIVKARITQQEVRFGEIGRRMQEIVEKEGELARVERGQRRKVRDRMRKMRKMEELEGVKDPQVPVVAVE